MSEAQLYRARAEECFAEADRTSLQNVRDRCLRAGAAWAAMAERGERAAAMRAEQQRVKAESA